MKLIAQLSKRYYETLAATSLAQAECIFSVGQCVVGVPDGAFQPGFSLFILNGPAIDYITPKEGRQVRYGLIRFRNEHIDDAEPVV